MPIYTECQVVLVTKQVFSKNEKTQDAGRKTEGYDFVMLTSRCGKGMVILAF